MIKNYPFDRPVIILAPPRSGSTLLFETLALHSELWSIGGESHLIFEGIPRFNPLAGTCDSNSLSDTDATPAAIEQIRYWFWQRLINSEGRSYHDFKNHRGTLVRLLEKTPKNSLRVSLLNAIFPDAIFIYLYRNPRETISSMMEAWESGRFVTYDRLPGREQPWSLLLPTGWQSYSNAPLEQVVAFQWRSSSLSIVNELKKLDPKRWISVSYGQQVFQPAETIKRICDFCGISSGNPLSEITSKGSVLSRYTVTPPQKDKWRKYTAELRRVVPDLESTVQHIKALTEGIPPEEFDLTID